MCLRPPQFNADESKLRLSQRNVDQTDDSDRSHRRCRTVIRCIRPVAPVCSLHLIHRSLESAADGIWVGSTVSPFRMAHDRHQQTDAERLTDHATASVVSGAASIWRWGHRGSGERKSPSGVQEQSPWWVVPGGIASRKLIAVIKDIWLPNHAQF